MKCGGGDLLAHGSARQDDEDLFDLFGAHRRIDGAQEELEQARAADLHERYELVHLRCGLLLGHVTEEVRHASQVVAHVDAQRNRDSLAARLHIMHIHIIGTQQTWNWVIGSPGQWVIWVILRVRVTVSSF